MAIEFKLAYTGNEINEKLRKIDNLAEKSELPTKLSDLTNDSGFITDYTETDPTVPAWAKASTKPSYTASEVGALPDSTVIPAALSDLTDDVAHRTVTDAEKALWNAKSDFSGNYNDLTNKPVIPSIDGLASESYVDNKIAAIPTPDVSGQINTHNTATDSHNDIRLLVEGLTIRLNTLADSDDTTLDQMSEVVAYIKSNKGLIDGITTSKINVSDIIDNLTTNVTNKPLSAAQGVALKSLIDELTKSLLDYQSKGNNQNIINVKNYGATGDGETDDTEAIASAIADVKVGGTLYFPEGVYRVDNINLKSDMTVKGDGWCSVIQLLDNTTNYHWLNNCLSIDNVSNVIIRDIKLDGNRAEQMATAAAQDQRLNGIFMRNASNVLVENVWMYNNGYHGCIMVYTSDVVFTNCRATYNGFRPIHGHTKIYNCHVTDCVFENNGKGLTGGSGFENDSIFFFGAQNVVISNNIVKSNRRGCITVGSEQGEFGEDKIDTRNITISGNVCECYADLAGVDEADSDTGVQKFSSMGIVVYGGKHILENVSVTGNTIKNAHLAIYLYSSEGNDGTIANINTTISGNTIQDCSYGVYANYSADVIIADNHFSNLAIEWMHAYIIANFHIHGNNVNAYGTSSTELCRITYSNNVIIRDNNIMGDCVSAIYAPTSNSDIVVVNNTVYGFSGTNPIVNSNGVTTGNIIDAKPEIEAKKVCVDPYSNTGAIKVSTLGQMSSTAWRYTTPVAITDADISYELNTLLSVPIEYENPADYQPVTSTIAAIVFLTGTALSDVVGVCTAYNGRCTAEFSKACVEGTSKNTFGLRLSITADQVKEIFPTATHVMMQVEATNSALQNPAFLTLSDGHAYVYRIKGEGDGYVLTDTDKAEIAELAAQMVDVPEGGNIDLSGYVKSVNGLTPDENGNLEITISDIPSIDDIHTYIDNTILGGAW